MTETTIDVFCHLLTPRFCERALEVCAAPPFMWERARRMKVMVDIDARLELMSRFPGYRQIPSLASPPIEMLGTPEQTPELAAIANDEMAEICARHPEMFPAFVASLPLNNPEASLREAERAVGELGAAGVQVFTPILGAPVDRPEYLEIFELTARLGKAVWLHPAGGMNRPDYESETESKFESWWVLRWPYETSVAMYRLAMSGIFDRRPDMVIITHHCGGTIPMMAGRLDSGLELLGTRTPEAHRAAVETPIREKPIDAMRRFHADTASFGSRAAIECGLAFFGVDRMMFASDMPFDPEEGPGYIRETLRAVSEMDLSDEDRRKILSGNAERAFGLMRKSRG